MDGKSCTDAFSSLMWLTILQISIKVFMKEIENCISPQMIKIYYLVNSATHYSCCQLRTID